jgi:hypothetical protein
VRSELFDKDVEEAAAEPATLGEGYILVQVGYHSSNPTFLLISHSSTSMAEKQTGLLISSEIDLKSALKYCCVKKDDAVTI